MRQAVKRTATIERRFDGAADERANCAATTGADSTPRTSHGSRIVALGPCITVATTLPSSVMLAVQVGKGGAPPKKVASTFPSGVSNRINVGARESITNPVFLEVV